MCSTCGSTLVSRPSLPRNRAGTTTSTVGTNTAYTERYTTPAVPEHLVNDLRESTAGLSSLIAGLRGRVADLRDQATRIQEAADNIRNLPPEAMDPQQAQSRNRPTAKATLDSLPRIVVDKQAALLHSTTIQLTKKTNASTTEESTNATTATTTPTTTLSLDAVLGEFGPPPPFSLQQARMVLATPKTGKGGLTPRTKQALSPSSSASSTIAYMERGDGVTFVKKAILAQTSGASALIVGNNTSATWPYVMKDSKGEAGSLGLKIPVVMVKQSDGLSLTRFCTNLGGGSLLSRKNDDCCVTCNLDVRPATRECIICVEPFTIGQTVLQLPACGHMFHEKCALVWLTQHNSCPYCRRELPTDDEAYEAERRRTQRTHAGSTNSSDVSLATTIQRDDMYG